MTGDDTARLLYLALLGSVIAFWFFMQNKSSLNKTLQQAAVWALIFIGAIAVAGLWNDIRKSVNPSIASISADGSISVPRAPDGHYYMMLDVNGTAVHFVVDTGATDIVLSQQDALRIGIDPGTLIYAGRANTANGEVRTAPVWLDSVAIGPITDTAVAASVNEGDMDTSLLGMGYLQRFERIEISGGKLVLTR
jgi:aspartyl protease family protein